MEQSWAPSLGVGDSSRLVVNRGELSWNWSIVEAEVGQGEIIVSIEGDGKNWVGYMMRSSVIGGI